MKNIRTYLSKLVIFIIAIQILNLSVYGSQYMQRTTDDNGNAVLSINQIDSFVEYVIEEVVVHKNVFPEHKGNHTKNNGKIIKTPFQIFVPQQIASLNTDEYSDVVVYSLFNKQLLRLYYEEINPKPPQGC